jgi:nitrate reductase alpha subunit
LRERFMALMTIEPKPAAAADLNDYDWVDAMHAAAVACEWVMVWKKVPFEGMFVHHSPSMEKHDLDRMNRRMNQVFDELAARRTG